MRVAHWTVCSVCRYRRCGNSSTFEQILTLTDDVAPVFDFVPADYTIECDQPVVYEAATAMDNCWELR